MPEPNRIEPLTVHGLADYHCHCDFSVDARGSINEYCEAALRRGLAEICFTTHWDTSGVSSTDDNVIRIDGILKPAVPENLAPYVEAVRRADRKYYTLGLAVKLGLEYGWHTGCEEAAAALKRQYDFDHFLCGLHELDGLCFSCEGCYPKCFARYTVEELVAGYLRDLTAAARTGMFDCLAHLDYLRKFGDGHYGPGLNDLLTEGLPGLFEALKETRTALEVNTSAVRRGFREYFPSMKIVNLARRAGVAVQYLGSDAHAPDQVGYDFDAASALVNHWPEDCVED